MVLFLFQATFQVMGQEVLIGNNQEKFSPFMARQGSVYRTASGKPGPEYWQNRADYNIKVSLDESTGILSGNVMITYYNNSPENLDFVWLSLEQNRFT